ncbi:MAG TPA: hypothetical protein VFZ16_05330 [Hyphomicrobiaceae bacterium]|jgi:hypothetical protein|nr:hypothetical protein [Hyphomicrobiaceae bacterium]
MIAIVLSICLVSDPGICQEQSIHIFREMSPMACAMTAPPHIAKWNDEHPEWHVERWRCRAAGGQEG